LQLLADADCAATQGVFLELNAMEAGGKHALLKKTPLPDVTLERIAQKPITTPWFVKPAPQTVVEIVIYANCPPPQSAQGMTSCMLP
jgi:hypothetical protein